MRFLIRCLARLRDSHCDLNAKGERAQRGQAGEAQPLARAPVRASLELGAVDEVSRRRRIEAEALLAHRLRRLAELDGARSVDDGLVSHAEYQLYLDERRAEGEFRQPDHWLDGRFPRGEGRMPVLGVRYRDALAFCQWLTERDLDGWRYRLPRADECALGGVPRSVQLELPPGGSFWVTAAGGEGRLVRASNRECNLRAADLAAWIERDLAAGRDLFVESALVLGRDLASRLGLDPDLDRAESRELAIALVDALKRVLDRARDVDRRLAEALDAAIDGANRIDYALDGGGARGIGEVVAQAHDVDRALAVAHYRANAVPRARGLARATSRAIDRVRDLNLAVARASISDVVRILLLTGNRASAVDRVHVLVQDVVHNLDAAGDLGADLDFAHTLSRVRDLDLALMLVRACDVSRPLDLDRLVAGGFSLDQDHREGGLVRDLARVRAVLHDPDLDHAGAHAIDRAQARALEHTLTRDRDLVRALSRCGELARAQALAHAGDLARANAGAREIAAELDRPGALGLLVDRDLSGRPKLEWKELSHSLRQFIRFGALARAIELGALLQVPPDPWTERPTETQEHPSAQRERLEAQRDVALEVYIQLGILEDRIEGHLPAWEGIRIVAARKSGELGRCHSLSDSQTRRDSPG